MSVSIPLRQISMRRGYAACPLSGRNSTYRLCRFEASSDAMQTFSRKGTSNRMMTAQASWQRARRSKARADRIRATLLEWW
jgi:hypothetical protein